MDGQDAIPQNWNDLTSMRERLARIETKLDILIDHSDTTSIKLESLEVRQNNLELGRVANRSDIASQDLRLRVLEKIVVDADFSVTQFREWKGKVDRMIESQSSVAIEAKGKSIAFKQTGALVTASFGVCVSLVYPLVIVLKAVGVLH